MIKEAGGDTTGVIEIDSFCDRLCPQPAPDKKKWSVFETAFNFY